MRDYALPRDDDGNLAAPLAKDADAEGAGEEDAEEEEPVDPNNLVMRGVERGSAAVCRQSTDQIFSAEPISHPFASL